jgi:hypothetical protein
VLFGWRLFKQIAKGTLDMKKLSLALALLGLSSTAAYAGGIDYQEPEESGVFMIGLEALYVRPHGSDFVYALQYKTDNANNVYGRSLQVDPDYQFGYHVDVAYAMPGDGPDISLGYTHLRTDDHENKGAINSSNFATVGGAGFGTAGSGVVRAKSDYDYIDVDFLLGKEFVLQNRYHFHPFAGVRYADIDSKDRAVYTYEGNVVGSADIRNTFDGVGPRAGVDVAMEIANGFSFVARAAGSVIIGNFDWKYTVANSGASAIAGAVSNTFKNSDEHLIAPEADYRLGVNYTHEFSPDTSFGLELGWTAVQYFDVKDKSAARITSTVGNMSDWGFQGPYLRVQANIA